MATLALAAVGSAIGSAVLPAGLSAFGATLTGAAIGSQVGALAGSFVDHALFASSGQARALQGPRLSSLKIMASREGAPIPRLYGRSRLGGEVIWAADFEEVVSTTESGSGKGSGSSSGSATQQVEYTYFASFAVGLCEGAISGLGRVWADGKELDLSTITYRLYTGSDTQLPDSRIAANLGLDQTPAFRGLAYIVFERLALAHFGRRLPQLSFEVLRPLDDTRDLIRGVVLIPGAGEFVYEPTAVTRLGEASTQIPENVHTRSGAVDILRSLDDLQASIPNVQSVSLAVSWFGTDLRAPYCQIKPSVEILDKVTTPHAWSVAGLVRETARVVSTYNGLPAYGGTPTDASVIATIAELKRRGLKVTLNPFLLMDIPTGNTLPDPYGASSQAAYPWRGRLTLTNAPGQPGSTDKSAASASEINQFMGVAAITDFSVQGSSVIYAGPDEWSFRRFVLHYAFLAQAAGGVDAFLLGSELRGLTQIRSRDAAYPFVTALIALATDVKTVLGVQTKLTYAADWSEYFGHQPQDGSGDVLFNLDPLWASPSIDAIGVDLYWPLSDWRDGRDHADARAGASSTYDLAYLKSQIAGGEGYDWYYHSNADRDLQLRTPITDGLGKPWVFRFKDLKSWWQNQHFNRLKGAEAATPTAWVPQSKPFWIMECGCPAIDKGANLPNAFPDPKSAEAALPYFSTGSRDDLIQRRYIRALLEGLNPANPGAVTGANPQSLVYGGAMIDMSLAHVYAWDARPYPAFPADSSIWGDTDNWQLGHWLNGRILSVPLDRLVSEILRDYEFAAFDAAKLTATVSGYVVDRLMSPREVLQPLELAYFFDCIESGGQILFRPRGAANPVATLTPDQLVEKNAKTDLISLTRAQETDLPARAKITYISGESDYRQAVAEARRLAGASGRTAQADVPIVNEAFAAQQLAETWLYEAWAAREKVLLTLPPSQLAVEPSDALALKIAGRSMLLRVTEVGDHGARDITATSLVPGVYERSAAPVRTATLTPAPLTGQPTAVFLDLPLLRGDEPQAAGYVAALQVPWPGGIAIYRSPSTTGFALKTVATTPTVMGQTLTDLVPGPASRLDRGAKLRIKLDRGALTSASLLAVLSGANVMAIAKAQGDWEVFQFTDATLVAPLTYDLSGLLRGQAGTEFVTNAVLPAGSRVVLVHSALSRIDLTSDEIGLAFNWRIGPSTRDVGDASYVAAAHVFVGAGLRPLSPVRIKGQRSSGDLQISWIRRTRSGGDSWDGPDVPVSEEREAYEIDILSNGKVKRTLSSSTTSVLYAASDQITDFGSTQVALSVNIYQLGARYGRGVAGSAVI